MDFPLDEENKKNIKPHWMRQMGTLMINHAIQAKGFDCETCHAQNGLLDFKELGYSDARAGELEKLPELERYDFSDDEPAAKKPVKVERDKPRLAPDHIIKPDPSEHGIHEM